MPATASAGPRRGHELPQEDWGAYFAFVAAEARDLLASVRVRPARAMLNGIRRRPLRSISYDGAQDMLELTVGHNARSRVALRYFIAAPRRIDIAALDGVTAITVLDGGGLSTEIELLGCDGSRLMAHGQWAREHLRRGRGEGTRLHRCEDADS